MTVSELIDLLATVPANAQVYLDNGQPVLEEYITVEVVKDDDEIVGYCITKDTEPVQLNLPFSEGDDDANHK